MVFHCRCFPPLLEEDEEIKHETATRTKASSVTETFYTALSVLIQSVTLNFTQKPSNLRIFTLAEINAATKNFSTKIGRGENGSTYKGVIKSLEHPFDEIHVAVKSDRKSLQGRKEWKRGTKVLGAVEHPNLVKLIGYCSEDYNRLLVYEYMANGSVRDHLLVNSETLLWTMRLKVAQDVARGLTYLHEETGFQIISRNFNSSRILLDYQWNAKLSDFGVCQILDPDGDCNFYQTKPVGPEEYTPPEYHRLRTLTSKSDVWSYGVFLYELITSRHPVDLRRPRGEEGLLGWVKPYVESKRFDQIVDPKLKGNYPTESVEKLSIIADKCLSANPNSRPKMREILEMVNQLIRGPLQASNQSTSPASSQVPHVEVNPHEDLAAPTHGGKRNKNTNQEGQNGSMRVQLKKPACLPRISPLKMLKSCSKQGCCVSLT